jgi:hypothetical protein
MSESKEYKLANITVKAQKSDGGGFYEVTFPNGEVVRCLASVFEDVAVEVKD